MRRIVFASLAIVVMLAAASLAGAAQLKGYCLYVWQGLVGGTANLQIFDNLGNYCGTATLAGVGPAGAATTAWETNVANLLSVPPNAPSHFGVWYTASGFAASTCPARDGLPGVAVGALNSYYISAF